MINVLEMKTASEVWRRGFGVHANESELDKAASTKPLDATAKVLGVKSLHVTPFHQQLDDQAVAQRKSVYAIR